MAKRTVISLMLLVISVSWNTIRSDCPISGDEIENGNLVYENESDSNLTQVPVNYFLSFECDAGYQLTEPRNLFCLEKGWNNNFPQCLKLNCPKAPRLKYAKFEIQKATFATPVIGSYIEYSCLPGYEMKVPSDNIITCTLRNSTAMWTGKLSYCIETKTCPDPGISPNGYRSGDCCSIGNKVKYSCGTGFELVGNQSITCQRGGNWSKSRPRCRPAPDLYCPDPPKIKHGQVIGAKKNDYYDLYDEVEIVCDKGYTFFGENRYVLCEDDYAWDIDFGECRETFCPRPPIPTNGTIIELENNNATEFAENFELTFSCEEGFRLRGDNIRECSKGKWSGKETYCDEIRCYDPNVPENGMRNGDDFSIGAKVEFSCFAGYELLGSPERYCMPNGQWNGEIARCNIETNHCPNPGIPINGKTNGSKYGEGDKVQFVCHPGFTLIGNSIRECLKNGTWSGNQPKCLGVNDFDNKYEVSEILIEAMDEKAEKQAAELMEYEASLKLLKETVVRQRKLDLNSPKRLILYFIFDVSGSVKEPNFKKSIKFAQALVRKVKVSQNGARVGALTFSSKAEEEFLPLQYSTTEEVIEHLGKIKFKNGGTATNSALQLVWETTYLVQANLGFNTQSVIFMLTDGKANIGGNPKNSAKLLMEAGVEIYCIGITGSVKANGLYDLASEPIDEHVFILSDYNVMEWLVQEITNGTIDYSQCGVGMEKVKKRQKEARVLGGEFAVEPWPWMVAVDVKRRGSLHSTKVSCGASIINQQYLLTAAHCLKNEDDITLPTANFIFKLGLTNMTNKKYLQEHEAEKFIIHPDYNPDTYDYDMALIKLNRLIEFGEYIRPICLPTGPSEKSKLYVPNNIAYATGWGYDKKVPIGQKVSQSVSNLKELRLPIQDPKTCLESLLNKKMKNGSFTERMFCAGSGDGGSTDAKQVLLRSAESRLQSQLAINYPGGRFLCYCSKKWNPVKEACYYILSNEPSFSSLLLNALLQWEFIKECKSFMVMDVLLLALCGAGSTNPKIAKLEH